MKLFISWDKTISFYYFLIIFLDNQGEQVKIT